MPVSRENVVPHDGEENHLGNPCTVNITGQKRVYTVSNPLSAENACRE